MSDGADVLLGTLEQLLLLPAANVTSTLANAADLVAAALHADKVDAFLYIPERDSLIACGTSHQPLSQLQRRLGLDVLPLANGGRSVQVYRTKTTWADGNVEADDAELAGIKQALGIRSQIAAPLVFGEAARGVLLVTWTTPDRVTPDGIRFTEALARWIAVLADHAELSERAAVDAEERGRRSGADEVVTVLAHDLRNHLAPLDMRIDMIRRRAEKEERDRDVEDATLARRTLGRLVSLIDDMLDIARVEQGLFHLRVEALDLVPLLRETGASLSTAQQPVEVHATESLVVAADPARIRQCAENLIANALKHSPRGAPVIVSAERVPHQDGHWAHVDVVDHGPGIDVDILPRIFDRYVTGDTRQGGLGLGLYLAKRVADLHGGELGVTSSPGHGARFFLRLPLAG